MAAVAPPAVPMCVPVNAGPEALAGIIGPAVRRRLERPDGMYTAVPGL